MKLKKCANRVHIKKMFLGDIIFFVKFVCMILYEYDFLNESFILFKYVSLMVMKTRKYFFARFNLFFRALQRIRVNSEI